MTLETIQAQIANVIHDVKADVRFSRDRHGVIDGIVINTDDAGIYLFQQIKREMAEAGINGYMRIATPDSIRRVYISPDLGAALIT